MTWAEILNEGKNRLETAGVREAALDSWYLFQKNFQIGRAQYYLCRGEEADGGQMRLDSYYKMVQRRAEHYPLQYILGSQEFMGMEFLVNGHVLIPRQDTETLVELVLEENRAPGLSLLDMCTGSGCIAVSLAALGNFGRVEAADLSQEALRIAEKNSERLLPANKRVTFRESDLFSGFSARDRYDLIVSNPPYIPSVEIEKLELEVREYEPRMALDGAEDGLAFYRRIAEGSREFLSVSGKLYLEIGYNQAEAVRALLVRNGFQDIRVRKDLAGKDRVVCAARG